MRCFFRSDSSVGKPHFLWYSSRWRVHVAAAVLCELWGRHYFLWFYECFYIDINLKWLAAALDFISNVFKWKLKISFIFLFILGKLCWCIIIMLIFFPTKKNQRIKYPKRTVELRNFTRKQDIISRFKMCKIVCNSLEFCSPSLYSNMKFCTRGTNSGFFFVILIRAWS